MRAPRNLTTDMSDGYPHRDEQGRLVGLTDLLGFLLAGLVAGVVVLLVIDGLLALFGWSDFGSANGWLVVVLPVWLLVEQFRAWRELRGRIAPAVVGVAVGLALGILTTGLVADLPPLASGAVGALVAILAYALIWFYGIRWLRR
jgi:hypothetical protein